MDESALRIITSVSIKNFKSLKSVTLDDCRRINVLIGRPNVGKSNLLEALAMFDVPYMVNTSHKSLKNLVRIENTADLFHNGSSAITAEISANDDTLVIKRTSNNGLAVAITFPNDISKCSLSPSLILTTNNDQSDRQALLYYFIPQ